MELGHGGQITEKSMQEAMGGIEYLFGKEIFADVSRRGANADFVRVILKPTAACQREHETILLSKGKPDFSIHRAINFVRLGMNPVWFAGDLAKLFIEAEGTNVIGAKLISVD